MAANVGQLSTDELREIIGSVVEQKLKEMRASFAAAG